MALDTQPNEYIPTHTFPYIDVSYRPGLGNISQGDRVATQASRQNQAISNVENEVEWIKKHPYQGNLRNYMAYLGYNLDGSINDNLNYNLNSYHNLDSSLQKSIANDAFNRINAYKKKENKKHEFASLIFKKNAKLENDSRFEDYTLPFTAQDYRYDNAEPTMYTVKKGDNLYNIAKNNNIALEDLIKQNNIKNPSIIQIGQQLKLKDAPRVHYKNFNEYAKESGYNNLEAIQSIHHNGNYVVVSPSSHMLYVFDKNNNLLYKTNELNSGVSKNDYNNITYYKKDSDGNYVRNKNGNLVLDNMAGNLSTPAGIYQISGVGKYHGLPAYTRARFNPKTGKFDEDIASSFHAGYVAGDNSFITNGCIRLSDGSLVDLRKYINPGTYTYSLPQKGDSKFVARQGKLSYIADNPYETNSTWDDHNIYVDKSYSPLKIEAKNASGNKFYDRNQYLYSNSIVQNKERLMKDFNISSAHYNELAKIAMGLAQQETKFNTSRRKIAKDNGVSVLAKIRHSLGGNAPSRGMTQIKYEDDNVQTQDIYKKYGVTINNINQANESALATMIRLITMYKNEVQGKTFKDKSGNNINSYDALLYKWMGHGDRLKNGTATPSQNVYIRNVKKYSNNYNYYNGEVW